MPPKNRNCKNCGQEFEPTRDWHIFCSDNCRKINWFKLHREYWNYYVKGWIRNKKYVDSLIDFEPTKNDWLELERDKYISRT